MSKPQLDPGSSTAQLPTISIAGSDPAGAATGIAVDTADTGCPAVVNQYIGGYRILERLGEGGMGVVFKAEQRHPRRLVALKVIRPMLLSGSSLRSTSSHP